MPVFEDEEVPTAAGRHSLNIRLARALHEIDERDRQIKDLEQRLVALKDAGRAEVEPETCDPTWGQPPQPRETPNPKTSERLGSERLTSGHFAEESRQAVLWHSISIGERERDSLPPSQRKAVRRAVELEIEFDLDTQFYTGLTQDISEGGVFIATYGIHPIGTVLALSFELPTGTKVTAQGEVRWLRDASATCRPGMGVAFTKLDAVSLEAVARFCRENEPLYVEV